MSERERVRERERECVCVCVRERVTVWQQERKRCNGRRECVNYSKAIIIPAFALGSVFARTKNLAMQ